MKIKKINVHLTEEQIEQRVRELGAEISKVYGDEPDMPDLYFEGIGIFYLRTGKAYYFTG